MEVLGGDLDFHHLLALLLEWKEVWLFMECCHKVVVVFDDEEMKQGGSRLAKYCPYQVVAVP